MVESKLAGPACRSPLVSKPRTGKADGTTEISERMIFSLFFLVGFKTLLTSLEGRNVVRSCNDGK